MQKVVEREEAAKPEKISKPVKAADKPSAISAATTSGSGCPGNNHRVCGRSAVALTSAK